MAEWYYARDGERFGPVDRAGLRDLALRGDLRPEDLVWGEGMSGWVEARTVEGLLDDAPPSGPPDSRRERSPRPPLHPREGQTPGIVIAGFVLSVVGLVTVVCAPLCPVGAALCIAGLDEARRRNAGVGLATAGIVIGIIGFLLTIALLVLLLSAGASFS